MNVVIGVGGGIAAYKAAELVRSLLERGCRVQAVLTGGAQEFIRPLTFAALTGRKVITGMFDAANPEGTLSSAVEHIGVAQENDVLAKFAHGLAGDFLSTLYLAFTGPVVLAPAMNNNMWTHSATQANVETLRGRGHAIVEPEEGFLACGTVGPGRLAQPERIADAVIAALHPVRDLAGEMVLVTAGPTREPLDPVRYISNRSSGKMGYALAEAAAARGAEVLLISGPVELNAPRGVRRISILTAEEMRSRVFENLDRAGIIVMCAAVADFRAAHVPEHKIKKTAARLSLELDPAPDILAELGCKKGERFLIGFAAETGNLQQEARRKLETKNCDMIVANLVGRKDSGFESDRNEVLLALRNGELIEIPPASKREIADRILEAALMLRSALKPSHAR
ncbi:MAG: bifunctional phosphopantothenoylcysteine decarboxylase/phosphopantothenate--cysteine ligase CoaBC [Acidobacteriota bacterium]|nr:bifunctional phosphopantothenoylcysteine decarboxylase/phosphopantothenate--cysteine ligase CoaBC [Acidobacteriota bacterium]